MDGITRIRNNRPRLEHQLERKLHRPWTSLLILGGHRPEARVQHLNGLAKCGICIGWIYKTEVGMIQNVECLRSKLEGKGVAQVELSTNRRVQLCCAESPSKVSRCGLSAANTRKAKGRRIDGLAARVEWPMKICWLAGYKIQIAVISEACPWICHKVPVERDGKCSAYTQASIQSPAIEQRIRNA